ncbi:MAG: hypothetical protein NT077_01335, partial [Candidatus Taylorbacteria bacterium]|nr:hypothetical protein [Candidatus Taylorbacteria bacterium]
MKLSDTSTVSAIDTYYGGLYLGGTASDYTYGMEVAPGSITRVFGYSGIALSFTNATTDFTTRSTADKNDMFNFTPNGVFAILQPGNGTGSGIINFKKSRGTNTVPTAITSGYDLGKFDFYGYNDAFRLGATIKAVSDTGTGVTGADMPGALLFLTSSDGSATPVERMRITSSGSVGIGTTNPGQRLEVAGNAIIGTNTGGSLYLYQPNTNWGI